MKEEMKNLHENAEGENERGSQIWKIKRENFPADERMQP